MSIRAAAAKFNIPYPTLSRPKHIIKGSATKLLGRFPTTMNLSWFALLDLSTAFDTVDHHILLDCLQSAFAIRGSVIDCIQSFIMNRSQTISFAGDVSTESVVTCGVPQGSVRHGTNPHKHCIALWSERSFICRRYPFVRPL